MTAVKSTIPDFTIVDESFNQLDIASCRLLISTDAGELSFAVFHNPNNRFVVFRRYFFDSLALLNDITSGDEFLAQKNFKSYACAVVSSKSTLIPAAFYDDENFQEVLAFNHNISASESVIKNDFRLFDAKNIFAVNNELLHVIQSSFPGVKLFHSSVPLIESLLLRNKNKRQPFVNANMQRTLMELTVIQNGQLQFFNSFHCPAPEDFIYFILYVYEQLELNPETVPLELSGHIQRHSAFHTITTKYIRKVEFAQRTTNSGFSYGFDKLPQHEYHTLFDLNLCVS